MGDFFGGLYGGGGGGGIRKPEVVMNDGPLPPLSTLGGSYPAGFNGTPDGKIDYASSLLGNVNPYAYGEADRLSTQTAYLNIPHRVQRIVPTLRLPEAQPWESGGSFFRLSHQVDDGDIAFVIRAMFSPYELVEEKKKYNRQGILYAVDPVVNMATVNYMLHGLQRFGFDKKHVSWHTLWQALGIDHHFSNRFFGRTLSAALQDCENDLAKLQASSEKDKNISQKKLIMMCIIRRLRKELVEHLIKDVIRPFGVPTGSERQGGQHQGSNSAITWPVDFVTTLTIDGLVINLINFWRHEDVNSGDDLMLYIEERSYTEYVLSHHPKNVRKQVFPSLRKWDTIRALDVVRGGTEYAQKKRARSETNYSDNAAAMFLDRLWDVIAFMKLEEGVQMNLGSVGIEQIIKHSEFKNIENDIIGGDEKAFINMFHTTHVGIEPVFQLVPGISGSASPGVRNAVWRHGYWHVARSQTMHFKYDQHLDIPNGYHAAVRGKVLQVTFSPVWAEPLEDAGMFGGSGCTTGSTFAVDSQDRHCAPSSKRQRLAGVVADAVVPESESAMVDAWIYSGDVPPSNTGRGRIGGRSTVSFIGGGAPDPKLPDSLSMSNVFDVDKIDKLEFLEQGLRELAKGTMELNGNVVPESLVPSLVAKLPESTPELTKSTLIPAIIAFATIKSKLMAPLNVVVAPLDAYFKKTSASVVEKLLSSCDEEMMTTITNLISLRDTNENAVRLYMRFSIPCTISTILQMVHGSAKEVPLPFGNKFQVSDFMKIDDYIDGDKGYAMLKNDKNGLLVKTAAACALLLCGKDQEKTLKDVKDFFAGAQPDNASVESKNLRKMMGSAKLDTSLVAGKEMWCMLGAYIGASVGLGAIHAEGNFELTVLMEKNSKILDPKDQNFPKTGKELVIAAASRWMIFLGMKIAVVLSEEKFLTECVGNAFQLVQKKIFKAIGMCFAYTCFLAHKKLFTGSRIETAESFELPEHDMANMISMIRSEGDLSEFEFTKVNYLSHKSRVRINSQKKDKDEFYIQRVIEDAKNNPFSAGGAIVGVLISVCEQEPDVWAKNLQKGFENIAKSWLDDPKNAKYHIKSKVTDYQSALYEMKDDIKDESFTALMKSADSKCTIIQNIGFLSALEEKNLEEFVDVELSGIHVMHYKRALRACMKVLVPLAKITWDNYEESVGILANKDIVRILLVTPAMVLACKRMIDGSEARDEMSVDETGLDLVRGINSASRLKTIRDDKYYMAFACAVECQTNNANVRANLIPLIAGVTSVEELAIENSLMGRLESRFIPTFRARGASDGSIARIHNDYLIRMMFGCACAKITWELETLAIDARTEANLLADFSTHLYSAAASVYVLDPVDVYTNKKPNIFDDRSQIAEFEKYWLIVLVDLYVKDTRASGGLTDKLMGYVTGTRNIDRANTVKQMLAVLHAEVPRSANVVSEINPNGQDGMKLSEEVQAEKQLELPQAVPEVSGGGTVARSSKLKKVSAKLLS